MSSMDWRQALLRWRIQFRRGTTDAWESANPVLLLGEPGWDVDLLRMKIGDGETAWNDLPWASLDPTQLQEILDLLEDLPDLDDERMSTVIADVGSDFFGLLSDYVESVTADYIPLTQRGANNGVATLDSGGKLPTSQLPTSVMDFKGAWNASTNSPTLVDGTGDAGDQYRVSVAGTRNLGSGSIVFDIGDAVIYSGTVWQKYDNTESVSSVAGKTGVVVLARADVGLDDAGLDTAMTGVLDDTGSDFTAGLNASIAKQAVPRSSAVEINLADAGLIDAASSQANGRTNQAILAAAVAAAPTGAVIVLPLPTVSGALYFEPQSGQTSIIDVTKDVLIRFPNGIAGKIKFGPESPAAIVKMFGLAAATTLTLEDINVEGPTTQGVGVTFGVHMAASTGGTSGKVALRRNVRITKCNFPIKADGDALNLPLSTNIVHVGEDCYLESAAGSCVLHNGGSITTARTARFKTVGGTSLNHLFYLAPHVAYDIDGTLLDTPGYGVHHYGAPGTFATQPPAHAIFRGKITGACGSAGMITGKLGRTVIASGAVIAPTTGAGITTQGDTVISSGVRVLTPNAVIQAASAADAHTVWINDLDTISNIGPNVAGVTYRLRGGRYAPADAVSPIAAIGAAAIVYADGVTFEGGSPNGQQVRLTGGAIFKHRNCVWLNAAMPKALWSATAAFTPADEGKTVTVTGAGAAGATLTTTVAQYLSPKKVLLAAACSTNVTAQTVTVDGVARATDGIMDTRDLLGVYATGSGTTVEGDGGEYAVDSKAWASDGTATGRILLPRRIGAAVASTGNLVLGGGADTYHITGTTTINNIYLPNGNTSYMSLFSGRIRLIADAAWTLSATGNIVPAKAGARTAGTITELQYDPATSKWYELGAL